MGIYNAELFNNLGLCCFYAQQYDMILTCFEQALSLAADEAVADVWYNIAHIAIVSLVQYQSYYKPHDCMEFFLSLFNDSPTTEIEVVNGNDKMIILLSVKQSRRK